MKKGDLLLCNDGVTKVEIAGFDKTDVLVLYKNKIHRRPRTCIGQTLHFLTTCKVCGEDISTLFCEKCEHCGWLICENCGNCHPGKCAHSNRYSQDDDDEEYENRRMFLYLTDDDASFDEEDYNEEEYDDGKFDYGYGGDDGPDDLYDYYYNDDYDGDDYNDY